ncbi:hypothetical protein MPSI1_000604 [Malassezia psittaci]|uniref:Uncharacterized protein n=1 Tax=Malassezia psittaci TaxID=1821823 RepID=A0AAF0F917_9BASI|nr:hypothetical protein MPSI1_000604 [Malassezia psittaci]
MLASGPLRLRIRLLPPGLPVQKSVPQQAANIARKATPSAPTPTVIEKLESMQLPPNVRLEPYVPRKVRFWKVSKPERDQLWSEFKEM